MTRTRRVLLIVLAVVLPVALALGAYLISAGVGASAGVVPVPAGGAIVQVRPSQGPSDDRGPKATPSVSPSDDHSGKCLEPEHANDPTCTSGSVGSGGSGSGSGSGHGSGGGDD